MDVKRLTLFFASALKAEMDRQPRGMRLKLAAEAGVSPSLITDIVTRRKYGSEESRRALANALGWEYEEFLRYGECLTMGKEYKLPMRADPAYDPAHYLAIPFHKRVQQVAAPDGKVYVADLTEMNQPIVLHRAMLDKHGQSKALAAFQMPDNSMEPTIFEHDFIVVDTADRACQAGKLYLVVLDSARKGATVRRVDRSDMENDIFLHSSSPHCRAQLLKRPWPEIVVGRVVRIFINCD